MAIPKISNFLIQLNPQNSPMHGMASKITTNPNPPIFVLSISNSSPKSTNLSSISFSPIARKRRIPQHALKRRSTVVASYAPPRNEESLYQVLGISETESSPSDIKRAYKKMAMKYHPDVSPPDRIEENTKRFVMVKEAYETLSNPQQRALYDHDLAQGTQSGFPHRRNHHHSQEMERTENWKTRWQSQLDGLKRRSAAREASGRRSNKS